MGGFLGGPKGMLAPPFKLLGGPGPPAPPPSSYAYAVYFSVSRVKRHGVYAYQYAAVPMVAGPKGPQGKFRILIFYVP